jgi:hypothetical protein
VVRGLIRPGLIGFDPADFATITRAPRVGHTLVYPKFGHASTGWHRRSSSRGSVTSTTIAAPMIQLCLDIEHAHVERLGDRHPLLLQWWRSTSGIGVDLAEMPGRALEAARLGIEIDAVRPRIHLSLAAGQSHWAMAQGVSVRGDPREVFTVALRWAHRAMYKRYADRATRADAVEREAAQRTMRDLYARLHELAVHAARACDPRARALAMRFAPHLRFRVYERLLRDPTGRIAQLAVACPGTVIFALALVERWGTPGLVEAAERIFDRVIAGHWLDAILDEAIDTWAAMAPDAESDPTDHVGSRSWAGSRTQLEPRRRTCCASSASSAC